MSDSMKLKGSVEVILQDKNGNVKQRELKDNSITNAAYRYFLYSCFNTTTTAGLQTTLRCNAVLGTKAVKSRVDPATTGIYTLSQDVNVTGTTIVPPYVDNSRVGLNNKVSFFNVSGTAAEATNQFIPVDTRCYYDQIKNELVVEYQKTTGSGTVKSIVVGGAHTELSASKFFGTQMVDYSFPEQFQQNTSSYLPIIEHSVSDGTTIHFAAASNYSVAANLKTKNYDGISGNPYYQSLSSFNSSTFVAAAVNGNLFKISRGTPTGTTIPCTLTYQKNFKTASYTTSTLALTFPVREGFTAYANSYPVMVARPVLNKLEIFITVSVDEFDPEGVGANVWKAVIDVTDPNNIPAPTYIDCGVIPYIVSNAPVVSNANKMHGFYNDSKYYLPYTNYINPDKSQLAVEVADVYQEGIVINTEFDTVSDFYIAKVGSYIPNHVVGIDNKVMQMITSIATKPYMYYSQVLSGTNLDTAVSKGPDDILRIIYRYKIS
jgi:hypothetical protein